MKSHLAAAWNLTTEAGLIKKFNFLPAFLDTLILSLTLLYQIAYIWVDIIGVQSQFFGFVLQTVDNIWDSGHMFQLILGACIVGLVYLLTIYLLQNVFSGGLIHLIRAFFMKKHQQYKVLPAISSGFRHCLALIEYNGMFFWAKSLYIVYVFIWGTRFIGSEYIFQIAIFAVVYTLIIIVTKILFAYTRFFIVIEDKPIFPALGASVNMAITNLDTTMKLFFSLIIVYVRIIFVILAMILLPVVVSAIVALGLSQLYLFLALSIVGVVYLLLLIVIAHISSILEIFIETLWFSFYMQNKYVEDK